MIGRKSRQPEDDVVVGPQGYDDFEVRLGDVMRGERATMGKSLLDVEREIRIKANYIAAIENCDPTAFDTPGFIAGYVRSYSRYLNLDPDEAFAQFCAESGFETAHGMSEAASIVKRRDPVVQSTARDPFADPRISFAPAGDSFFSRIEPAAIGSSLVLIALVAGIGYGGYSVLQEVQRVRLAPVDQTPVVLTDLDPVDVATAAPETEDQVADAGAGPFTPPSPEALDRLYRPEALDVPVLIARDAPISTLDPSSVGAFADAGSRRLPERPGSEAPRDFDAFAGLPQGDSRLSGIDDALAQAMGQEAPASPQVLEATGPGVTMIAVRPAWVRVRAADGSVIFEGIMNAGDTYDVPRTEEPPSLRIGESGAVYFALNGQTYGPVGPRGSVTSNLALSVDNLTETYSVAELQQDADLARVVAELNIAASPAATE